ncbi:MAG: glycosyltransferase family 87 protein [Planctomycetota bacterium]
MGGSDAPRDDRTLRIVIAVVVIAVVIATTVAYVGKVRRGRSAFLRWQPQVRQILDTDIYAEHEYPNTPVMALALLPLASLPPATGAIVFFGLKLALAAVAVTWSLRLAFAGRRPVPAWAVAILLALAARPILSDLQHGNINILVLFLVMAGLVAWTGRRDLLAGVLLGVATVVKVTPGLLLPYMLWKRQWRTVAGFGLGAGLAILGPALVLGPARDAELHAAWFDLMVRPYLVDGEVRATTHINQSLPGVVFRLLTDSGGVDASDDEPVHRINLASMDPGAARWLVRGLSLAVVAWLAFVCRTPCLPRRRWRLAAELGLVLIAMLLLSERSWKHHYVTMVLPLAALVASLGWLPERSAVRRSVIAVLAGVFVLTSCMSGDLVGWIHRGVAHKYVEGYGSFLWAAVAVFAMLSALLLRGEGDGPHPAESGPDPGCPVMDGGRPGR